MQLSDPIYFFWQLSGASRSIFYRSCPQRRVTPPPRGATFVLL